MLALPAFLGGAYLLPYLFVTTYRYGGRIDVLLIGGRGSRSAAGAGG